MGDWKAPLSRRVRNELRSELEVIAKRERRTLGNLGEILIEWATERLREAGGTEKLLQRPVPVPRNPDGNYGRSLRQKP
jgi:hypothetical protein